MLKSRGRSDCKNIDKCNNQQLSTLVNSNTNVTFHTMLQMLVFYICNYICKNYRFKVRKMQLLTRFGCKGVWAGILC